MGDTKNGLFIITIFYMYYDKKLPVCITIINNCHIFPIFAQYKIV